MTTNVPNDVIDDLNEAAKYADPDGYEPVTEAKEFPIVAKFITKYNQLRAQRQQGAEPVAWDAEAFERLDQFDSNKWVVHKPEGAPYAGIRTKDGRTIAGTSSGLSDEHAQEICANQQNREYIKVLLKKITDLQRQIESTPPQVNALVAAAYRKAAEICESVASERGSGEAYGAAKVCAEEILAAIPKESADALREYVRGKCMEVANDINGFMEDYAQLSEENLLERVNSVLGEGGK
jgi:hypothetical protein